MNSNKAIKELNPKNGQGAWPEPLEADSTSRGGGHALASLALNGATPQKHNELRYSDKQGNLHTLLQRAFQITESPPPTPHTRLS